jgi:DNA-binding NarL/FixJ family response regulator
VLHTSETDGHGSTAQGRTATLAKRDVEMTAPRILLADDQEEMLQALVEMLEDEFQIVGTAENGTRVLELAPRLAPDIVVLDISMPMLNGLEAALYLKQQCSSARVVFLTAHEDPDLVEAGMSVGALGYVVKSCLATDLVPALWRALAGKTFISPSLNNPE